jgi:malate dehydrogenase (oxaloacetate-decarboxylating)(NADP+)
VVEEGIAQPILIGRRAVVEKRIKAFGLSIVVDRDFTLVDPQNDPRYNDYVATLLSIAGRRGINPNTARTLVRTNATVIGALALARGEADALLCGLEGRFGSRLAYLRDIVGVAPGVSEYSSMSLLISSKGAFFMADTHVRREPTAAEIAETALLCAVHVRRFGLKPKIALLSHSDFGSDNFSPVAAKMREAVEIIRQNAPELEVDGEMAADSALSQDVRNLVLPGSRLKGEANVLIMPDLSSANIAYQMTKMMTDALPVGPILLGSARPAHILTPSITARGIANMTAVAVVEAQQKDQEHDMA